MTSYSRFLMTALAGMAFATAQERPPLYQESLRPQFHFTARYWDEYMLNPPNHHEGWMNDMNGLVHNDGEYHFFAQRWWSAWLHATSTDLIHWKETKPAFGKGGKFGGTQSGGCVVDHANSSGLGDGKTPPMVAFWSSTDNLSQCISYSRDRGRTWTKYEKNPVLAHAHRDPKVFWYEPDKKWIMILYGPADEASQRPIAYGFNGEQNDAHQMRSAKPGEWISSVMRVFPDGKVLVSDQNGTAEGRIDAGKLNIGKENFRIGGKADGSELLSGDIAEILVYDRTLTDGEAADCLKLMQGERLPGNADYPAHGLKLRLDAGLVEHNEDGGIGRWRDLSGNGNSMLAKAGRLQVKRVKDAPGDRQHAFHFSGKESLEGPAVLDEGDDSFTITAVWRREKAGGSEVVCEQNSANREPGRRAALLTVAVNEPENHYLLFESRNLLDWTRLPGSIPDSYECPDMFELPVEGALNERKWVIIDANGDYVLGSFDGRKVLTETSKRKGDHGRNFYATMTFENMPKQDPRRIQMAWMRGWDDYPKDMPFNQQASFPCELTLRRSGDQTILCRNPIREISKIHGTTFSLKDQILKPGTNPLAEMKGEMFDIRLRLDISRSNCDKLVLRTHGNVTEYDLKSRKLRSRGTEVALSPVEDEIEIRVLVDRLSLETFGNRGEVSITNIAYQNRDLPSLELEAVGGSAFVESLEVHELRSIWK